MKSIYVGNLHYKATKQQIWDLFAQFGEVVNLTMVNDKRTKRFKGSAFVEMSDSNAECAIEMLANFNFLGREISVREATRDNIKTK